MRGNNMGVLFFGILLLAGVSCYGVYIYSSQGDSDIARVAQMLGDVRGDLKTFLKGFEKLSTDIEANNTKIMSLEDSAKKLNERVDELEKVPKEPKPPKQKVYDVRIIEMPGRVAKLDVPPPLITNKKVQGKMKLTPAAKPPEANSEVAK